MAAQGECANLVGKYVQEEGRRPGLCIDAELHGCMKAEEGKAFGRVEENAERDRKRES